MNTTTTPHSVNPVLLITLIIVKQSGRILLQSPPSGVDVNDIKHDLEKIHGVLSVHELHVWRLNQLKALASAHIVIAEPSLESFQRQVRTINECLHAYGVHSSTIQPELVGQQGSSFNSDGTQRTDLVTCLMNCGPSCEELTCCGQIKED